MSTGNEVITLINLTEQLVEGIYNAKSQANIASVLNRFLADHAQIEVNGRKFSRQDLIQEFLNETRQEAVATVKFLGEVQGIPKAPVHHAANEKSVGIFYTVAIRGALKTTEDSNLINTVTGSINAVYQVPEVSIVSTNKIIQLNLVVAEVPA